MAVRDRHGTVFVAEVRHGQSRQRIQTASQHPQHFCGAAGFFCRCCARWRLERLSCLSRQQLGVGQLRLQKLCQICFQDREIEMALVPSPICCLQARDITGAIITYTLRNDSSSWQ